MADEPIIFPEIRTKDEAILIDDNDHGSNEFRPEIVKQEVIELGPDSSDEMEKHHVEPLSDAFIQRVQREQEKEQDRDESVKIEHEDDQIEILTQEPPRRRRRQQSRQQKQREEQQQPHTQQTQQQQQPFVIELADDDNEDDNEQIDVIDVDKESDTEPFTSTKSEQLPPGGLSPASLSLLKLWNKLLTVNHNFPNNLFPPGVRDVPAARELMKKVKETIAKGEKNAAEYCVGALRGRLVQHAARCRQCEDECTDRLVEELAARKTMLERDIEEREAMMNSREHIENSSELFRNLCKQFELNQPTTDLTEVAEMLRRVKKAKTE